MATYKQAYDSQNKCIGVVRDDGANIPRNILNRDWRAFLDWNSQQAIPLDLSDLPPPVIKISRTLIAIRADLASLTNTQKNNIWTDITSGSPPKWSTDAGSNAAALAVLTLLGASSTLSAADVLEAKLRGVAMYCQDNPTYLVNPSFDPTINVPGDQVA